MAAISVPSQPLEASTSSTFPESGIYQQAPAVELNIVCSAPLNDSLYSLAPLEASPSQFHQRSTTEPSRSPSAPSERAVRLRSRTSQSGSNETAQSLSDEEGLKPKGSLIKKMFQCTGYGACKMSFSRAEHLARHVRKHTGERPFQCHCGREFSRLDNLRQHAQTVHADQSELNNEMMVRLAAVHNSLASASSGRKSKAKAKASTPKKPKADVVEDDGDRTPAPHPLEPATTTYFSQMSQQPAVLMHSPYQTSAATPTALDFGQRMPFSMPEHQDMVPIYEDHVVQSGEIHPDDFAAYALYSKPTLPSISALIPRRGGQVSQQEIAQFGLLPSPLPPTTTSYSGHTPSVSAPAYMYGQQVSPKSPHSGQMAQQQQQHMDHYMASLHNNQLYPYPVPYQQEVDPNFQFLPRSFSASSASSACSQNSEPSLMSGTSTMSSYPSTPSPNSKQHMRMPANTYNDHVPYAGTSMHPQQIPYPQSSYSMFYQPLPLPPNSHEQLPTDLSTPHFSQPPPPFARRQSLNDLLSAASATRSPNPGQQQYQSSPGRASPGMKRSREDLQDDAMLKRQHVMA